MSLIPHSTRQAQHGFGEEILIAVKTAAKGGEQAARAAALGRY